MGQIQREIVLKADESQLTSSMGRAADSISGAFERAGSDIEKVSTKVDGIYNVVEQRLLSVEQSVESIFTEIVQDSDKLNQSVSERLQYMEREVSLVERIAKEEKELAKIKENLAHSERMRVADREDATAREMSELSTMHKERLSQIGIEGSVDEMQANKLRQKFEEYKDDDGDDDGGGATRRGGRQRRGGRFGRRVLGTAAGAAGLGFAVSIGGLIAGAIAEGEELSKATTSRFAAGLGGEGVGGGIGGLKEADFIRYAIASSQARGTKGDAGLLSRQQYRTEKSYNLQPGDLGELSTLMRGETGGRSASEGIYEMLNFLKDADLFEVGKDDYTQMNELLQYQNVLGRLQIDQTGEMSAKTSTQIVRAMGEMGLGGKGGTAEQLLSMTESLNQVLTGGGGQFQQALLFSLYEKQTPGASPFDVLKRMETGIKGGAMVGGEWMSNLATLLEGVQSLAGTGDDSKILLGQAMGSYWKAERTLNQWSTPEGRMYTKRIGSEEDAAIERVTDKTTTERFNRTYTVLEGVLSDLKTALAESGKEALDYVGGLMNTWRAASDAGESPIAAVMKELGSDIVDAIEEGFQNAVNNFLGREKTQEQIDKDKTSREAADAAVVAAKESGELSSLHGTFLDVRGQKVYNIREKALEAFYDANRVTKGMVDEPPFVEVMKFHHQVKQGIFGMSTPARNPGWSMEDIKSGQKLEVKGGYSWDSLYQMSGGQFQALMVAALKQGVNTITQEQANEIIKSVKPTQKSDNVTFEPTD